MQERHPDIVKAIDCYVRIKMMYTDVYEVVSHIGTEADAKRYDRPTLADLGFILQEIAEILDELKKDARGRGVLCDRILCEDMLKDLMEKPDTAQVEIKTDIVTSTPSFGKMAALPKSDDPDYKVFLLDMGLKPELLEMNFIKFDFKKLGEYVTKLAAEGKKFPAWLKKTYPDNSMSHRRRKGTIFNKGKESTKNETPE